MVKIPVALQSDGTIDGLFDDWAILKVKIYWYWTPKQCNIEWSIQSNPRWVSGLK